MGSIAAGVGGFMQYCCRDVLICEFFVINV